MILRNEHVRHPGVARRETRVDLHDIVSNLADHTSDAIVIAEAEPIHQPGPRVVWCNRAFTDMTGYLPEEIIGKTPRILQGPKSDRETIGQISQCLRNWKSVRAHLLNYRKNGEEFWVDLNIKPVADTTGWYRFWVAIQREVTEFRETQLRLEAANQLLRRQEMLLENAKDLAVITDGEGRIEWTNPAFVRQTGFALDEVRGRKPGELLQGPGTDPASVRAIGRALNAGRPIDIEVLNYTKSGAPYWIDMSIVPVRDDGRITNFVAIQRDITARRSHAVELESLNQKIEHQTRHDAVTGLPNRDWFTWAYADRSKPRDGAPSALNTFCIIDINDFYLVNDAYGHDAGDEVLRSLASRLVGIAGPQAVIVRLSGDEFAVLVQLDDFDRDSQRWAQDLKDAIKEPIAFDQHAITLTVTAGLAPIGDGAGDFALAEKQAEAALRYAQRCGKRFAVYDDAVKQRSESLRWFASNVGQALENREFVPFFQIQVDATTLKPAGVETLTRWQHPNRGIILPANFLPAAHALKLVDRIDDLVANAAVRHFERWMAQGSAPAKMSINLRAARLLDPEFVSALLALQERIGRLAIELLETSLDDDLHEVLIPKLMEVRRSGIQIEIDDFGTGQASIMSLIRLKPDRIKIDRNLVPGHFAHADKLEAVSAIVILARTIGARVTAEGVETAEQAKILAEIGIDTLQGFYFGRPQPADHFSQPVMCQRSEKSLAFVLR